VCNTARLEPLEQHPGCASAVTEFDRVKRSAVIVSRDEPVFEGAHWSFVSLLQVEVSTNNDDRVHASQQPEVDVLVLRHEVAALVF
jgi:hypothetical protein